MLTEDSVVATDHLNDSDSAPALMSGLPGENGHAAPVENPAPTEPQAEPAAVPLVSEYPRPPALDNTEEFVWDDDRSPVDNYHDLGEQLANFDDLYRAPDYAGGLLLATKCPKVSPTPITKGSHLAAIVADRLRICCVKSGKPVGGRIPSDHLKTMLATEAFLQPFRAVDEVTKAPMYLNDLRLTVPGYNDGGPGQRILHHGPPAWIEPTTDTICKFLEVMAFATNADRTNAVAAALTVLLGNHFLGAKPMIGITSTKSHGGKGTIADFASGNTRTAQISYQATDWALERSFVGALKHDPEIRLVNVDNARLGKEKSIKSAFLERFITDPEPFLFSTGSGGPARRRNNIVVAMTTNFGTKSEDLMNRDLPIHLTPTGNVADRQSPIGNPRFEFLPRNRDRIEAELRGMIQKWIAAGKPRDTEVRHPCTEWAAVIGGILRVNGFNDFLANYNLHRTADDPVRHALGLLGGAHTDDWLPSAEWATLVGMLGLVKVVIPESDRDSDGGRVRGIGVVLSAHQGETFDVTTEDENLRLRLEKGRRRFDAGKISTRYRFVVLTREPIPEDSDEVSNSQFQDPSVHLES